MDLDKWLLTGQVWWKLRAGSGRGTAGFGEDVSLSFISLRRMEGLIVLHDKGSLIMVSIRQIRSNTSVSLALS